jgi:hypothetical protein
VKTVVFGGRTAHFSDRDLLGAGGEAEVYRVGDRAVKIYHAFAGAALARKLDKVRAFPRPLPKQVLAPEEIATDETGAPIGFTMPIAESSSEILHLGRRAFREGKVTGPEVLAIFAELRVVLLELHAAKVVAGDLNDGNILISLTAKRLFLIDADSMQFGNFPCEVGHEKYLDPRLYGADLSARPCFDAASDWYAFSVLLFTSLLYVHPYGGAHPNYPTLLRRAEARHSILRADVKRPKSAEDISVLSAPLHKYFEAVFDRGERLEPPLALFAAGAVHLFGAPLAPATRRTGRCRAIDIFSTRGRILTAVVQGKLRFVYEEGGALRRENGALVLEEPPPPELVAAISGETTYLGLDEKIVAVRDGAVASIKETDKFRGVPMFDANASELFHLSGDELQEGDNIPRGKILEGQTWFRTGDSLGFGYWIAGRSTFYFIFRPGQSGFFDVRLPPLPLHVIETAAVFAEDRILFSVTARDGGRMVLLDGRGKILGTLEGQHRALENARGKWVKQNQIFVATDAGVVVLEPDPKSGHLAETAVFADTEPFVCATDELLPGPNGSLYVKNEREIRQLVLE